MSIWLKDPKTGEISVSFSLMVYTLILAVIAGGLQLFGVVKDVGIFLELSVLKTSLYFGRRLTFKGVTSGPEAGDAVETK